MPHDRREQAAEARKKFVHRDGDHLTLLNLLWEYQKVKGDKEWCRENFVNVRNVKHVLVSVSRKGVLMFGDIPKVLACFRNISLYQRLHKHLKIHLH